MNGFYFKNGINTITTSNFIGSSFQGLSSNGIQIRGKGSYVINGKEYTADKVQVRTEYKVLPSGETVYTEPNEVSITFNESPEQLDVQSISGDININCTKKCSVNSVKCTSGAVHVDGDVSNISAISGDVTIHGNVKNASTVSGNIKRK